MTPKHAVKVTIASEDYTIRSERDADYTRQVAGYVDQCIRRVLHAGPMVESHKAAILAALAITDELFEARRHQQELAERLRQLTGDMARLLPPQKRQSVAG
jgi:cell division protein ZapA